jgi:tetratricopeptide (TPR) repeat protein
MTRKINLLLVISGVFIMTGCNYYKAKQYVKELQQKDIKGIEISYPFPHTLFPPEFYPPTFLWNDTLNIKAKEWYAFISDKKTGKILIKDKTNTSSWKPDSIKWEKIKKAGIDKSYIFTVASFNGVTHQYSCGRTDFSFSNDSVGADIFFRAVTLPFSYAVKNVHTIEWYMGSVKGGKPRLLLTNLPVCGNCHSFPIHGKPQLAMDVDYGNDKGSYSIAEINDTCRLRPDNIISWSNYKRDENEATYGLLSQISPNSDYVLSTVKDLSVFVAVDDNLAYSQLFFPIKGIIGIYNTKNKSFSSLNGANDPKYVQSNPSWSPDEKKIIFARTDAYVNEKVQQSGRAILSMNDVKEFTSGNKPFKFSLYKIDFNEGKGGVPEPIEGASNNGKSNYFAKYSPDGKWIVFCQADNFMLLQPDARMYIMPAQGGTPRLMNCNLPSMNSWHSWSPNSKWIVFSSKYRGIYTQLYLTHIDENGNDSPPVLLENLLFEKRAANIPEFYPGNSSKFKAIKDEFSNTAPYFTQLCADNMVNGYYKRAWENIDKAIRLDSNYVEAYFQRILLNATLQQSNSIFDRADKARAEAIIDKNLKKYPDNDKLLLIQATLLSSYGKTDEALKVANSILKINPSSYKTYELIASIYRKNKEYEKTFAVYDKMQQLVPKNSIVLDQYRIDSYLSLKQYNNAMKIVNRLIDKHPYIDDYKIRRAQIALMMNDYDQAKKDLDYLKKQNSDNINVYEVEVQYYSNNPEAQRRIGEKAIELINKKLQISNEDIPLLFNKADFQAIIKDWNGYENTLNRILNIFPFNYEALKRKARLKIATKQWAEAVDIYNQLEKYYLPEEEFFNNRAIAKINLGDNDGALKDFNKLLQLNPNNNDARVNRERLLQMMGGTGNSH